MKTELRNLPASLAAMRCPAGAAILQAALVLFLLLAPRHCPGASWAGTDDFSSATLSSSKWTFYQQWLGQMTVHLTNGHASCLDPTSTISHQRAGMVWNGKPTAADGWMVDIIGHNTVPVGDGGSSLYLVVMDSPTLESGQLHGFTVAMGQHSGGSSFGTSWQYPGGYRDRIVVTCTNNTLFGLRLVYNPATRVIQAWYDPTGLGLRWTKLDSMRVSQMSPGMTATNTFSFAIVPDTFYGAISEGQMWADNFSIGPAPPQPGGAPLTVTVSPPGGGTVTPNYNGRLLQIGKTYSTIAKPGKGFSFVNWTGSAVSTSPRLSFLMASNLTLTANFKDTLRPVLKVLYPKNRQTVTSSAVTLTGKASDNAGVGAVYYQLNGGAWALAQGATAWSAANVVLAPGANVIRAYAVDVAGNTSLTNTVSFTYLVTAPLSLMMSPPGAGHLTPNYRGRLFQIGKTYSIIAKPAKGFSFVNWTGSAPSTSPKLTFLMASNLTFTANFKDTQRPVLTVLYPKARQTVTSSVLTATGKAGDNLGVDAVYYQLNRGPWALAQGTTAWSGPNLALVPGANVIRAYALDAAGNASLTQTVSFTYLVSAPLSVTASPPGGGTVTPNYNGHLLQIGKSYSMTAKPAKGFSFANWAGSAASASPKLTFVMASNLTFTANFKDTQRPLTYATLYSFGSVPHDGEHPAVSLTAVGSTLYGVTSKGGAYGRGTIFAIKTNGSGYTNLYSFGTNGEAGGPSGALTLVGGKLYGATRNGGNNGAGTIFSINTDGTGYTNIYGAFSDAFPGAWSPNSLVSDGSTLYGTSQGGNFYASCPQYPGQVGNPFGTALSIHLDGSAYNTLYDFGSLFGCQDTAYPVDKLILAGATLYGMSPDGGDGANWYGTGGVIGSGTIFSIRTDGSGYTILHNFGLGSDGVWPYGGLALVGSTLYGSTWTGGSESDGTIFAIDTDGANYHVLHNYQYANADFAPSGLTPAGSKLYGTVAAYSVTLYNGTIFSVNTDGSDYTILHKFGAVSKDGAHPEAALSLLGSTLYGTAYAGGKNGKGTVFSLSLPGGAGTSAGPGINKEPLSLVSPKLSISVSGDKVIVTWPGDAASFVLQSATNLLRPDWTSVLTEPASVNGVNTTDVPLSNGERFYRLRPVQ